MSFASTDTYLQEAKSFLNNNLKDSDAFLTELKQNQDISELQMIKNTGKICQTYFCNKVCLSRILDYDRIKYYV